MTADLELWLRGLFVSPNRCRHLLVKTTFEPLSNAVQLRCIDCGRSTALTRADFDQPRDIRRVVMLEKVWT